MNKKVLIIVMSIFLIVIFLGTISMVEFYYAKERDKMPIMAMKEDNIAKQYIKYSSLLYNVYNCYSGTIIVQGKKVDEPICNRIIRFNKEGYYINRNNLKISKQDYQMIYDISKTLNEIETFTTNEEVEKAKKIASEYQRILHIPIQTTIIDREIVNIEAFKEFVIFNEYGDYGWQYQRSNQKYLKCMKNGKYKEYKDGECIGNWKEFELSNEWCNLAKDNSIVSIKEVFNNYCNNTY